MVRVLYFAWVRERVGLAEEELDVPPDVPTVGALIDWLATTSPAHEAALADRARLRAAVDQAFVPLDAPVQGAREIAIFPAGDRRVIRVIVQREPIDLAGELARIEDGAVATFTGHVRPDDGVTTLELEHYPGATEAALTRLAEEASARWSLSAAVVVHRVGPMAPGERIVLVATASAHRTAALDACAYLIDRLKTDAPFWKRETVAGEARWVEARTGDEAAAAKWADGS